MNNKLSEKTRCFFLYLAAIFPLIFIRIASIWEQELSLRAIDLWGVCSDFGIASLLMLILLIGYKNFSIILFSIFVLLNSLLGYVNYEHIRALSEAVHFENLKYIFNETFLMGSGLKISRLFLFIITLFLPLIFIFIGRKARPKWKRITIISLTGIICLLIVSFRSENMEFSSWRQYNILHKNALVFLNKLREPSFSEVVPKYRLSKNVSPESLNKINQLFMPNLKGEPIVKFPQRKVNILMIIMEGISASNLSQYMEKLNTLAANKSLFYKNFITHGGKTNRGEYALLCGDYPNLVSSFPKMSIFAFGNKMGKKGLPEILSDNGYKTTYLQAAPLSFMHKNLFLKKIGFDESYGKYWFQKSKSYAWSSWGPDDRTFFEQSLRMVENLQNSQKPWFLTLLNVGTHHPYVTDSNFKSKYKLGTFENAVKYLDEGIYEFINELKDKGILENTLVVITSDESRGSEKSHSLSRTLSKNLIPLIVLTPNKEKKIISDPFTQIDLPLSIVDYIGKNKDREKISFIGRSIFRKYSTNRIIPFRRSYSSRIGLFESGKGILLCSNNFKDLDYYKSKSIHFVLDKWKKCQPEKEDISLLKIFLSKNEVTRRNILPKKYILYHPRKIGFHSPRRIYGDQYLFIPKNTLINYKLNFKLLKGTITLKMEIVSSKKRIQLFSKKISLKEQESYKGELSFYTKKTLPRTEFILNVNLPKNKEAILSIKKAVVFFNTKKIPHLPKKTLILSNNSSSKQK